MNLRDMLQKRAEAKAKYEEVRDGNASMEEIRAAHTEFNNWVEKVEMEQEVDSRNLDTLDTKIAKTKDEKVPVRELSVEEVEKRYTPVFLKALRKKSLSVEDREIFERVSELRAAPSDATPYLDSNTDESGGLIIPVDVQTKINEYKRAYPFNMQELVSSETVSFRSGTRVFEKLAESTPWIEIEEWDTIAEVPAMQFEKKQYSIKDYAGILPIPNRMLQDTDAALMDTVARYIARKTLITRNKVILDTLAELYSDPSDFSGLDAIKNALNVELDLAFVANAQIITNQDGYNYLDNLKDDTGNYLLQPDVVNGTGKTLLGKQVVVVPNRELPTKDTNAPVYIGSLKEVILFFDRGVYEVRGTDIGGDAFTRNSYDIRVIDRFGVESWDTAGVLAGFVDVSAP